MQDSGFVRRAGSLVLAGVLVATLTEASASVVTSSSARDLADVARSVKHGASIRIENLELDGAPAGADLERFDPVAPGARFVVQSAAGARAITPELPVYLRGSIDGVRGSVVALSVSASGEVRGVASGTSGTWMLERRAGAAGGIRSRRMDREALASATRGFTCDVLENPGPKREATLQLPSRILRLPIAYTAQIAVVLDYDYYSTFAPDADAAILYALDMMAFTGALGESELGMNVEVPYVELWTTSEDPYSGTTGSRLVQVRDRWNHGGAANCGGADCTAIARSTVLLVSSATSGGIAYVPGICDSYHSPNGGYSYAFVGGIGGSFDIDSPSAVWDIVATTHELGHNFGSSHTHCYNPPVDECWSSELNCYAGEPSLPSGCPGSGQGCGTIMSYCHQLGGGLDNISLTYGVGHPYGDAPERVPATMIAHLATEYAAAPACLSPTGGMQELTVATVGSGSGTVTSSPSGIDCEGGCRTYFDADTVVTLTPSPSAFSQFTGWSGDPDCNDGSVTMSAAVTCTATFTGTCGAGNEDCDDGDVCTVDSCPADDHCENASAPRSALECFHAGTAKMKIVNAADPVKDKLTWQWKSGEAFAQADLGDPSAETAYSVCVYDATGGVTSLATSLSIPAASEGWRDNDPDGWSWSDSDATHDGIRKLSLKTGIAGKTRIKLTAGGGLLPLPLPFSVGELFDEDTSVVVQLVTSDDSCWTSSFVTAGTSSNVPTSFKAAGN